LVGFLYWVAAVVLLGILILVHELGHFGAGRLCGLKVKAFGMGFGPKLFSHTAKDGVEYVLRLLPLGGYCRFYGEDETVENEADALYRQPVWKRAVMTVAGPLMNFVIALAALFLLYAAIGVPVTAPLVGSVTPGTPAAEAGLMEGDRFVALNGQTVDGYEMVQQAILDNGAAPVTFTVRRGSAELPITILPRILDESLGRPQIGITFGWEMYRFSIGTSTRYAFVATGRAVTQMLDFLRKLVTRGEGTSDMAGPIGTIQIIKEQTQTDGLPAYLSMTAMLGINLGLFNLLPIPGLDGSRLLFLLVEAIRRKRIDPNKEGLVHLVGIALLLMLLLPVYIRDIVRLFTGGAS
jgi:regulator of sigma E protease